MCDVISMSFKSNFTQYTLSLLSIAYVMHEGGKKSIFSQITKSDV